MFVAFSGTGGRACAIQVNRAELYPSPHEICLANFFHKRKNILNILLSVAPSNYVQLHKNYFSVLSLSLCSMFSFSVLIEPHFYVRRVCLQCFANKNLFLSLNSFLFHT